jgi:flagellar hook protein FlgE
LHPVFSLVKGFLEGWRGVCFFMGVHTFMVKNRIFRCFGAIFAGQFFTRWALALFIGAGLAGLAASGQNLSTNVFVTNIPTDLRISGAGEFVLKDPTSGELLVTRVGQFSFDANDYLVNNDGFRLQGFIDNSQTVLGDLRLQNWFNGNSYAYIQSYQILSDGKLWVNYSDGTAETVGQVLLQKIGAPSQLRAFNGYISLITSNALPLAQPVMPGALGLGNIVAGELEIPLPLLAMEKISPTTIHNEQGVLAETGLLSDFAIQGSGYFIFRDTNSGAFYASRAGACYMDGDGYLVNYAGMRLQGYDSPELAEIGDAQIPLDGSALGDPTLVSGYSVAENGNISVWLYDGSAYICGQILLTECLHPEALARTNFALVAVNTNAGGWTDYEQPMLGGPGWVNEGALELNQLDEAILNKRQHLNFFQQGEISMTNNTDDLALNGSGFFTVRNPVKNVYYATRNGEFHLDDGYLVNSNGYRVQGLVNPALTSAGDVRIDAQGAPAGEDTNQVPVVYNISNNNHILVMLADGTVFVRGAILIQNYRDLQALVPLPGLLYSNVQNAEPLFATNAIIDYGTLIIPSALEMPPVLPSLQLPPTNGWHITVSQLLNPGTLQSSSDLIHWTTVGRLDSSAMGTAEFYETNSSPSGNRFYRIEQ